jgi:sugar phosphate isomerase/epimerase
MKTHSSLSRRSFLSVCAASPLGMAAVRLAAAVKAIPIGLELYSVRHELEKDLLGTVERVAKMGYECVEFFSPYYQWTSEYARQVRRKLDELGVHCFSTHNSPLSFAPDGISKAIELNGILGSRYVVMASAGKVSGVDGWKQVAETLNRANETMKAHGLHVGYHNHDVEWKPVDGEKPIKILAANTDPSIMLQLDVGTCLETGNDPVAWVKANPGRIRSMHVKDWSPKDGYKVLLGEGVGPWDRLFRIAEDLGGIEFYLIEQEGSRFSELETAERCLAEYGKLHA